MCSGRVDLDFVFKAFANDRDGVLIGGCRLNDCTYVTQGNYDALGNAYIAKNILERIGLNPKRLAIEFMSGGPLGEAEGLDKRVVRGAIEAVRKLIPYLRLVEREKLRVPVRTEEAYHEFYNSEEVKRLFDELVGNNLTMSRIVSLIREKPRTIGEISEALGLSSSEVAKHMNSSSRQSLVRYDTGSNRYAVTR